MATSPLSAAGVCLRCCIRAPQWQPRAFTRNVSRTSAINRGIKESAKSPSSRGGSRTSSAFGSGRGDRDSRSARNDSYAATTPPGRTRSGFSDRENVKTGGYGHQRRDNPRQESRGPAYEGRKNGRSDGGSDMTTRDNRDRGSSDRRSTRRDERRDDRKGGGSKKGIWDDMVELNPGHPIRPKVGTRSRDTRDQGTSFNAAPRDRKPANTHTGDASDPRSGMVVRSPGAFPRGGRDQTRTSDRSVRPINDNGMGPPPRFAETRRAGTPDRPRASRDEGKSNQAQSEDTSIPVAIPYTTASSQWLYGTNTVVAALQGQKRKLFQLIVKKIKAPLPDAPGQILDLARRAGVKINTHDDTRLMDKLSDGRPHNNTLLEASALPTPPAALLRKPNAQTNTIAVELDKQNTEDIALNGETAALKYDGNSWRQPFVLFLDGITDPGNLGNILRTAHFYGVDAVAVAVRTCANLSSPVVAKASAGACEAIPIFTVSKAADFIRMSKKQGWNICASVAPNVNQNKLHKQSSSTSIAIRSPLASKPCILMMGSEGEGLRDNLLSKADLEVTIARGESPRGAIDVGVDSMNVSVATGVLVDAFVRRPATAVAASSNSSNRIF